MIVYVVLLAVTRTLALGPDPGVYADCIAAFGPTSSSGLWSLVTQRRPIGYMVLRVFLRQARSVASRSRIDVCATTALTVVSMLGGAVALVSLVSWLVAPRVFLPYVGGHCSGIQSSAAFSWWTLRLERRIFLVLGRSYWD